MIVVNYCRGRAKVYLPDGRQSPRLAIGDVRLWIERYA